MMRRMSLVNRRVGDLRMFEYLRKCGVPTGHTPRSMRLAYDKQTVFLPEITRINDLAWQARQVLTSAFRTWFRANVDVQKEANDVMVVLTDPWSKDERIVVVPTDGAKGAKFYVAHDGIRKNWVPDERMWVDFGETISDLANVGDLDEQVCHPAVPADIRREVMVQGVFFEGLLSPDEYITVRHADGRMLKPVEGILPVETIRTGQVVERLFLSSGMRAEAEIMVEKGGFCRIRYRRSAVDTTNRTLVLVPVIDGRCRPWVGNYQRVPAEFRDAAEQAYLGVAPVPGLSDKAADAAQKLESA